MNKQDFLARISSHLPREGRLLVGVSGGADSVALLAALTELEREVHVVTCNFHLRGEESDRDCQSVVKLCERLDVPLTVVDFDAAGYASEKKVSIEMACRELRYAKFRELQKELGCVRTAIAHNSDDNIETFFLNLMRSSGVKGLKGMVVDNGEIVRPLLETSRKEIEEYLESEGYTFVTDSTNADETYRRNYIRHTIIPAFEKMWPSCRNSILKTQAILSSEDAMIDIVLAENGDCLRFSDIEKLGETAVFRFAYAKGANTYQANEMWQHCSAPHKGKKWNLDGGTIYSDNGGFRFVSAENEKPEEYHILKLKNCEEVRRLVRTTDVADGVFLPTTPENYEWRRPVAGDRIKPLGMKGSKKVSDILKESKLDYSERLGRRVLVEKSSGEIIYVEGLKRSREALVNEKSPYIYLMTRSPKLIEIMNKFIAEDI